MCAGATHSWIKTTTAGYRNEMQRSDTKTPTVIPLRLLILLRLGRHAVKRFTFDSRKTECLDYKKMLNGTKLSKKFIYIRVL